ncbi:MAG TPA: excinuclease ABC subunit UvrC [Nitrospirae bacterium]|nr:excinuclease ABC subunit UvrC [Nitrospirota bacterium]HDZ01198.1 excinuclease ABC subunit UvrC [Nitrospirota bacterium]
MDIKKKLHQAPSSPGIYMMKGAGERVIYVGKAGNLRNRLRSYFQSSASLDERKLKMVKEVRDFEYVVTENELEALVLEANFIKRVKPRYNIILRDDKNYPYLKLTVNEEWPGLEVVRKIEKDGALYFGPYVPSGSMREMLKFIRRNFPIRRCRYNLAKPFRPCVQYQMGRCLAPCAKSLRTESDRERYLETVSEVRAFIQGEQKGLLSNLRDRMQKFSDELQFEEAAKIRDRLKALEKAWESQRVIAPELGDMDVIGLYRENREASIFMLFIRNGIVIGRKDFFLKKLGDMENRELIAGFIEQFYSKEMLLPPRIILPLKARLTTEKQWLSKKRGNVVKLTVARNEPEFRVLKMADDNALYSFNRHKETRVDETLLMIKKLLNLGRVPKRIGAIDVSNISGSEAVGAFIMYEEGRFIKDDYRLFKIKTVQGINDFAMIGEVVGRYLKGIADNEGRLPQLILVDGGMGQLKSALNALKQFGLPVEMAGMAKARDEMPDKKSGIRTDTDRIYLPGRKVPVFLEPFEASTHLLQNIRDEVHRFAVSYHKKLRTKRTLESPLEKIRGIGKTRRLLLLKHFQSIDAIRKASLDEIASLKGMNRKLAEDLKKSL